MKGLVVVELLLLLLLGTGGCSLRKGLGETRDSVSCERLRDGTGGGGRREGTLPEEANSHVAGDTAAEDEEEEEKEKGACSGDEEDDEEDEAEKRGAECRLREVVGNVAEDLGVGGGSMPERSELLRFRDWVLSQEEEPGTRSKGSVLKESGFHCASR